MKRMNQQKKAKKVTESDNNEYNYMLLDRLKSDCDYYLGNGNRNPKHLWAGNEQGQIDKIKELYNELPEKPEWLTMEQIEDYDKQMNVKELPSTEIESLGHRKHLELPKYNKNNLYHFVKTYYIWLFKKICRKGNCNRHRSI